MARRADTPPVSRRARKAAATREAIFAAAIAQFSARGFEAPTIDDIATAADVGKGTFYNYFSSKEEILVVHMIEAEAALGRKIDKLADAERSLTEILCNVVRTQLRLKRKNFAFHQVFLATLVRQGPQLLPHLVRMQDAVDPPLVALFTRLQRRGLVRPAVDIATAVFAFKCLQTGVFTIWSMTGPADDAAMAAAAVQIGPFAASLGD